jgi:hypothetical protein
MGKSWADDGQLTRLQLARATGTPYLNEFLERTTGFEPATLTLAR